MESIEAFTSAVRKLIGDDRLADALAQMQIFLEKSPLLDEVLVQSGRFEAVRREIRQGVTDRASAAINENQIRVALLELLREIEAQGKGLPAVKSEMENAIHIVNSKNVIANSNIHVTGDLHIGDTITNQNADKIYNIDRIDKADFS